MLGSRLLIHSLVLTDELSPCIATSSAETMSLILMENWMTWYLSVLSQEGASQLRASFVMSEIKGDTSFGDISDDSINKIGWAVGILIIGCLMMYFTWHIWRWLRHRRAAARVASSGDSNGPVGIELPQI